MAIYKLGKKYLCPECYQEGEESVLVLDPGEDRLYWYCIECGPQEEANPDKEPELCPSVVY